MRKVLICMLIAILMISVSGCNILGGGSGSSNTEDPAPPSGGDDPVIPTGDNTGYLVDNFIVGVAYSASPSGVTGTTGADGSYEYDDGDTVTFKLGEITLGSCTGSEYVTPMTLYPDDDELALNLAQFLQSIDSDGNPENGITPSEEAVETFKDIDFRNDGFEAQLRNNLPAGLSFVERNEAMKHMDSSFVHYGINPDGHGHQLSRLFAGYDDEHGLELWITKDGKTFNFLKEMDNGSTLSSYPAYFTSAGNKIFFKARTLEYGEELWVSDGTAAGTHMVKDSAEGYKSLEINGIYALGNKVVFTASTSDYGRELWISNGTEAGTHLLKDIYPGSEGSYPYGFTLYNGELYFVAKSVNEGYELWKTDGTANGTVLLKDIYIGVESSSPQFMTTAGGYLWFRAHDGTSHNLYKSQGTAATTVVEQPGIGTSANIVPFRDRIYYTSGASLCYSEGAGQVVLNAINYVNGLYATDSALYLLENNSLMYTDGLNAGAYTDVLDSSNNKTSNITEPLTVGDKLYFTTTVANANVGQELYVADGASFSLIKDIYNDGNNSSYPNDLVEINGKVYFKATTPDHGKELWVSDGTEAGTMELLDIVEGTDSPSIGNLTVIDSKLYFRASKDDDSEMWVSDGTTEGTKVLADINKAPQSGMNPTATFYRIGDKFVFNSGYTDTVWVSDGTAEGTKDTGYNYSYLYRVHEVIGDYFYFITEIDNNKAIIKTDGTISGTSVIELFDSLYTNTVRRVGDKLLFYGRKNSMDNYYTYITDLTENNAEILVDSDGNDILGVENTYTLGSDKAVIYANLTVDGIDTYKIYFTDGTPEGTQAAIVATPDDAFNAPSNITPVGDDIFFTLYTDEYGKELWVSDGTQAGTVMVADLTDGTDSTTFENFVNVNGTLYFTKLEQDEYLNLWKSDGTAEGTIAVKDLSLGRGMRYSYTATPLAVVGSKLYFSVTDYTEMDRVADLSASEIWVIDNKTGLSTQVDLGGLDLSTYTIYPPRQERGMVITDKEYLLVWFSSPEENKAVLKKVLGASSTTIQEITNIGEQPS